MREFGIPLNQLACADTYSAAATVNCPGARRLTIFVYNNSLLYQLAYDRDGSNFIDLESELPPGFHSFARDCNGVRFRNLIAGSVALVSVKMLR